MSITQIKILKLSIDNLTKRIKLFDSYDKSDGSFELLNPLLVTQNLNDKLSLIRDKHELKVYQYNNPEDNI